MRPMNLNTEYDALVIVLDERNNTSLKGDSFFERELNTVFEANKLIYHKNSQVSAEELFMDLAQKTRNHETMLPASQRMIICNYVDANNLSGEWFERYKARMETFMTMAPVRDGFQQYHITFIRYQAFQQIGEKQEEVFEVLQKIGEESMPMRHAEFLLYAGGLDNLDFHEKGVVCLLQLLTMKDYWRMYEHTQFDHALYLLAYEDYYAQRAQICKSEIEDIKKWLENAADPDFVNLELESKSVLSAILHHYNDEMRKFKRSSGLYPVSITEYSKHGVGPFTKYERNTRKHPELEKEKERYQRGFLNQLENSDEKKQFIQKLQDHMNYPDVQAYAAEAEKGMVRSRIKSIIESSFERASAEEKTIFEEILNTWIEEFLNGKMKELEKEKRRREDIKTQKEFETLQANHYDTLQECFDRIKGDVTFQAPAEIVPMTVGEITLVNGEVGSNWIDHGYHIEGIPDERVAILPAIAPCEIQYMKLGKYIDLNDGEQTKQKLRQILH